MQKMERCKKSREGIEQDKIKGDPLRRQLQGAAEKCRKQLGTRSTNQKPTGSTRAGTCAVKPGKTRVSTKAKVAQYGWFCSVFYKIGFKLLM